MRVTDWQRWGRTKQVVALILTVGGIACVGPAEAYIPPGAPMPSPIGAVICLSGALWLLLGTHYERR